MEVYCWGRGEDGQLGLGDSGDMEYPCLVDHLTVLGVTSINQIVCGSGHTVVLSSEGKVFSWGRGDDGRLGHGDSSWQLKPLEVKAISSRVVKQVTCGSYHTAAVTQEGDLYTWGGGMYGKLGHGNEIGFLAPKVVEALAEEVVLQVACGSRHTVVLVESNVNTGVYAWGDRANGVTGLGESQGHQYLPEQVYEISEIDVIQIAACGFHTAVVTKGGAVYSWGEGKFGRLGHGCEENYSVPTMVEDIMNEPIVQIACGGFHTAAISSSGKLFTWGGGEHGQLGHHTKGNCTRPTLVEDLSDWDIAQVTCGWSHTVALTTDGLVYTWGNGDHGKLGHGHSDKLLAPCVVKSLKGKDIRGIASYNEHTAALSCPPDYVETEEQVTSSLANDLKSVINDSTFSDVTFRVGGSEIHAHRAILSARCDHFRAMFTSGMKEANERVVDIPNLRYDVFYAVLNYIYTDRVDKLSAEMAIDVYIAADLYTLDHLKNKCEAAVRNQITIENAPILLKQVDDLNESKLRQCCLDYVVTNFEVVSKTRGFALLTRELILEILQKR